MLGAVLGLIFKVVALIVSHDCADILVNQGDIFHEQCLRLTLSKALGYGVVVGATIVKVPQIIKILRAKSAQGVSLVSHLLELTVYAISVTRNYKEELPFSTWGEGLFILIQLVILVVLILHYNKQHLLMAPILIIFATAVAGLLGHLQMIDPALYVPRELHSNLQQFVATPLSSLGRLIQIVDILRLGTTGQLSFITCFLNFAGSAARVFTTLQEVDDLIMLTSFLTAVTLNGILAALFLCYPSGARKAEAKTKKTK
ncbi:uncharacterized protein MONBRDRAFT_32128 [Monosiga brevicollis MX1]|uniref:Mannose-P-dolichol utilization defect 1 protein homolog n=1 Tax=Monosiga brevicollis TaxID=81824 RepID=A9UXU0_MONBE|nr:uncharacterized protein MONBRDRAFT_32128 [Monosiga brevicollis MX1]EDQ89904.1 predicted protein [Monosiga brevicollis MX1]|eukprot:XP_001745326.1 hypothetical protein [Monosiga brevicollis MX1]